MKKETNLELPAVGPEQLSLAWQLLQRCREGKHNLEQRIIENAQWYRLRHWECMRKNGEGKREVEPTSAWLFNCIMNKHAEALDAYPSPAFLPREARDRQESKILSAIVPVILEQNDFEEVYSRVWDDKLKGGTGVYGVFWDRDALGGLGDIAIRKVAVLNLYWDPGITDIQASRNLFHVELVDNDLLLEKYPQLLGKLGDPLSPSRYLYDDTVDVSHKTPVVDWYYKRRGALHYCKFVGQEVLWATENEEHFRDTGLYDHGMFPFVFDACFRMEGSPCGFSYIDVGKSAQEYIDRGNQAILMNMLANARPRHFIRTDGAVNEEEYADLTRDFIHVDGNLGRDSIIPVQGKTLSSIYVQVIQDKIDELKETTGNRDISAGGTSGGVTAASAITAMQEAGSKLTRDQNRASYRCFRKVCELIVELMRQFYTAPRCFRILGSGGAADFITYSNQGLRLQGEGTGLHKPVFDIQITAQKHSPYARLSQNELAMQFYTAGFFDPARAEQALACLEMMDFDRKDFIMESITRNAAAWQRRMVPVEHLPKLTRESPTAERSRQRVAESGNP